jgi:hypothetical protein
VNIFKTKTNLKINKPNRRDIFSTNYNIKLMHILKDILYSNRKKKTTNFSSDILLYKVKYNFVRTK